MSKTRIRSLIILGVLCVIILLGSVWYSNTFNDGRLVTPMDFSHYTFQPKDLPMTVAALLVTGYVVFLVISVVETVTISSRSDSPYTQTVNPKLGLLGFLGFLGLYGIWTYKTEQLIFPFVFFVFFGFFGFYYDGKMSHTLRDERFIENENRAQIAAYKSGLILMFLVANIVNMRFFSHNLEISALFMLSSISLIWGIAIFLSKYLLYRYDNGENSQ